MTNENSIWKNNWNSWKNRRKLSSLTRLILLKMMIELPRSRRSSLINLKPSKKRENNICRTSKPWFKKNRGLISSTNSEREKFSRSLSGQCKIRMTMRKIGKSCTWPTSYCQSCWGPRWIDKWANFLQLSPLSRPSKLQLVSMMQKPWYKSFWINKSHTEICLEKLLKTKREFWCWNNKEKSSTNSSRSSNLKKRLLTAPKEQSKMSIVILSIM